MPKTFPFILPSGNNFAPESSGTQTLGSASTPFSGVYATNLYGSHIMATRLVSGVNQSALTTDCFIDVDTTGGNRIITLPTAVGNAGKEYNIRKLSSDAYQVIVSGTSSQTINGVATKEILYQYTNMQLLSNGTNWRII